MMKKLLFFAFTLMSVGCAGTQEMEKQLQDLKAELKVEMSKEINSANETVKNDFKRDLTAVQQTLQTEYNAKFESAGKELLALKDLHQREMKDANFTLIDIQKDLFQHRRVTEDNSRRIAILEIIYTSTQPGRVEKTEGNISSVNGNEVVTDIGFNHGVKAGGILAVYKDSSTNKNIAKIRVTISEATKSTGEIIEKTGKVVSGYVVKPLK